MARSEYDLNSIELVIDDLDGLNEHSPWTQDENDRLSVQRDIDEARKSLKRLRDFFSEI